MDLLNSIQSTRVLMGSTYAKLLHDLGNTNQVNLTQLPCFPVPGGYNRFGDAGRLASLISSLRVTDPSGPLKGILQGFAERLDAYIADLKQIQTKLGTPPRPAG